MSDQSPSRHMVIIESVMIVLALVSLWPLLPALWAVGPVATLSDSLWYRVWLVLMLGAMVWVASRRIGRIRAAVDEAKRKRDESERGGRPPFLRG